MSGYLWGALSALGLGLVTSLHPCSLATNVAALSCLSRWTSSFRRVLAAGLLYAAGRIFAYVCLGALISLGAFSVPQAADVLQYYAGRLLGPLLVLSGMLVSGLLPAPHGLELSARVRSWTGGDDRKLAGSFLLGALLAAAFCPASAALFFGSLLPLAFSQGSRLGYPVAYGVGTGLPVVAMAVAFTTGVAATERKLKARRLLERWVVRAAGVVLISMGVYLTLHKVYRLI